jgi:hypothetical protein
MLTPETRKEGKHLLKGSNRLSRCLEWTSKLSLKSGPVRVDFLPLVIHEVSSELCVSDYDGYQF